MTLWGPSDGALLPRRRHLLFAADGEDEAGTQRRCASGPRRRSITFNALAALPQTGHPRRNPTGCLTSPTPVIRGLARKLPLRVESMHYPSAGSRTSMRRIPRARRRQRHRAMSTFHARSTPGPIRPSGAQRGEPPTTGRLLSRLGRSALSLTLRARLQPDRPPLTLIETQQTKDDHERNF